MLEIEETSSELQMEQFLDGFDIGPAQVWGIGPGRKQVLIAYGV